MRCLTQPQIIQFPATHHLPCGFSFQQLKLRNMKQSHHTWNCGSTNSRMSFFPLHIERIHSEMAVQCSIVAYGHDFAYGYQGDINYIHKKRWLTELLYSMSCVFWSLAPRAFLSFIAFSFHACHLCRQRETISWIAPTSFASGPCR